MPKDHLTPEHRAAARVVAGIVAGATKGAPSDLDALVQGYIDDITRDFQDVLDGDLLDSEARRRHRSYIKRDAEPAYDAGLAEGGVAPEEKDDADRAAIADWIAGQLEHVDGLWADIQALIDGYSGGTISQDDYKARRRAMYERIGTWGDSLRGLAGLGRASALANQSGTWQLGATEKHCRTCAKLSGQRHRLKWFTGKGYIPQENGSDTLECGGWRCDCSIVADDGSVLLP